MKIDFHVHSFPPEVVADRERFFDGEPAFRALYGHPKARLVDTPAVLEAMEQNGVDGAVIFGFPWKNRETARRHNDYVLESAAQNSRRLIPLACFDALSDWAVNEASRCLEAGVAGLGELAVYEACDERRALKAYEALMTLCRSFGRLMLVHANEPVGHLYPGKAPFGLGFYYQLASMCRDVPLILAHWGGGLFFYELLKKEAPQILAHVYYDTAASPFLYRSSVYRQALDIVGCDRILFGSDYPLLPPSRYEKDMDEAGLMPEEKTAILGQNALRLVTFDAALP
ncbi:MAG: amidohydrolase family protein [Desulfosoma sp.]